MFSSEPGVGPKSSIEFFEMRFAAGFCQGLRPPEPALPMAGTSGWGGRG